MDLNAGSLGFHKQPNKKTENSNDFNRIFANSEAPLLNAVLTKAAKQFPFFLKATRDSMTIKLCFGIIFILLVKSNADSLSGFDKIIYNSQESLMSIAENQLFFPMKCQDFINIVGTQYRTLAGLNNVVYTWDSLGIWAYQKPVVGDSEFTAIYFKFGNEKLPVAPKKMYSGVITIDSLEISNATTENEIIMNGFKRKGGGFYMKDYGCVKYMIMLDLDSGKIQNVSINWSCNPKPFFIKEKSTIG